MKKFEPIKFEVREIPPEKRPTHLVIAIDKDGYGEEYGSFWDKEEAKAYAYLHNIMISNGLKKSKKRA